MDPTTTEGKEQELAPEESRAHLNAALNEFATMMVATYDKKGKHPRLHARPMVVASVEPDCSLIFITHLPEPRPGDGGEPVEDGTVIAQSLTRHVSMLGTIEYSQDRRQINEVWKLPHNLFFGKGRDDPSLCLMIFRPRDAELWDLSGRKGLRFLFGAARSLIQRKTQDFAPDQHEKLKLHRA
ncbi:MAG: ral stress protein [Myxococcaceae bacterium]|nr:ral stress protein [Myxococcaceae bacterium]